MESFQIVFLSSEKREWGVSPVSWSKMDEMFPLVPFRGDESPAAEAGEVMVKIWHLEQDWGWEGGLCTEVLPLDFGSIHVIKIHMIR